MKTIGFIGLGTMGKPMATNLLKKGYSVLVYNRTKEKASELIEFGAEIAESPMSAAQSSDVLFTMLSDDQSIEQVYYGNQGIIHGVHPRLTVIDCSTVSPGTSKRIHKDLLSHAVHFLDAPVTGSKPAAIDGTLVFMVGGHQDVLDEKIDLFETLGSKVLYMGDSGSGSQTKLALNTIAGINLVALSEGLSIVAKSGIDVEKFLQIVLSGAASSRQAELKGSKIINRDFSNQFSLKLMLKDLKLARQLTDSLKVPTPLLEAAADRYQIAMNQGWGEEDLSSVIRCYEEEMGLQINGETKERRTSIRVPLNIDLQLSVYQWEQEGAFSGQNLEGTLYDLSNNGLQIISAAPLAQDMFIVIHFPKNAELPPITGKIIRIEAPQSQDKQMFRYGCLISGIAPHIRARLEQYIQDHLDQN